MKLYFSRPAVVAAVCSLLVGGLTACGGSVAGEPAAGPGLSDLAPTYDVVPESPGAGKRDARAGHDRKPRTEGRRPDRRAAHDNASPSAPRSRPPGQATPSATQAARPTRPQSPRPADPGPVTVTDPRGDLSRSLEGAPGSADIVAVQVDVTGDTVEVRTTFAAEVPERMTGGKGMNVASFYDVDGNGLVDYEIWVSLADNGWGTGYRDAREGTAAFGPSTGIEVTVAGATLTTRFPVDRIGGAQRFRWSAASEWGSYQSMAAATSARDYAPDDGAVAYPG